MFTYPALTLTKLKVPCLQPEQGVSACTSIAVGQFKPLAGSQAFIGEVGQLETVDEFKLEMVCEAQFIKQVLAALKAAHPYEEPAYDVYKALTLEELN